MIRSLFASHDNGDSVILYLFMLNNGLRIISRWRVVKNYFLGKNNYVSLIFFLKSASAWDFPSSINFFFSYSLRPDCLVCVLSFKSLYLSSSQRTI